MVKNQTIAMVASAFLLMVVLGAFIILKDKEMFEQGESLEKRSNPDGLCKKCNVVLITSDTLRADRVGAHDTDASLTPNIDAFAKESLLFTDVLSQSGTTYLSVASLFSSKYSFDNIASWKNNRGTINPNITMLPRMLSKEGYQTHAIISNNHLKTLCIDHSDFGFESFDDSYEPKRDPCKNGDTKRAQAVSDDAIAWLEGHQSTPFFLWVNYVDPHVPHMRLENYSGKYRDMCTAQSTDTACAEQTYDCWGVPCMLNEYEKGMIINDYDANVQYLDYHAGRLIEYLLSQGMDEDTIIIFLSTHGESLGERMSFNHNWWYQEQVQVPLIMRVPGQNPMTIEYPVSLIDVAPTVLHFLNVSSWEGMRGISLLESRGKDEIRYTGYSAKGSAVLQGNWKLVIDRNGTYHLYDISKDPLEEFPIESTHEKIFAELMAGRESMIEAEP